MSEPFFIDRSLSPKGFVSALEEAGWSVVSMRSHYGESVARGLNDEVWIRDQAALGRPILSLDHHITINPNEARAIVESGAVVFVFPTGNLTQAEQVERLIANESEIARLAALPGPAAYVVYERIVSRIPINANH